MEVASRPDSPQHAIDARFSSLEPEDVVIPYSPTRGAPTRHTAAKRHTKGLSLNFPILLPPNAQTSKSPIGSGIPSPTDSARSSPRSRVAPLQSPIATDKSPEKNKTRGGGEFLTLLAAQERKVLELKEELQRAETDLLALKKQWATHEANKKRDEVRQVKKLQPVALDDVHASEASAAEEDVDEERRRKRALVERNYANQTATMSNGGSGLTQKGSKRVFEGGRHTRTLSLLSPTSTSYSARRPEELKQAPDDLSQEEPEDDRRPSLSRMSTLDNLMSGDALPSGFGKTYKDLASHRRSLPPVATDMLVKQGKQVYDGVKDGLWTFFEDIRQATVGEEGIHGTVAQQRPIRQPQRKASRTASDKGAKNRRGDAMETAKSKEQSFWNEFGLDTPQRYSDGPPQSVDKTNGHVQQQSSTDSSNPPSLLADLNDVDEVNEVDDGWDTWDSPTSNKTNKAGREGTSQKGDDINISLPWPDIQKTATPKLTRTISDLMKEWDSSQTDLTANGSRDKPTHILDSPHI